MMARLAALYPAPWRARYGEEFAAFLEAQPATPAAMIDLILGALDAHLEGEKGVSGMVAKWRTPAAMTITLGGFLWLVGRFGGDVVHLLWPAYLVEATGMLIVALGIIGLARLPERGQPLSIGVGSLAVVGLLLTGGIEFISIFANQTFQQLGPWPFWIALAGLAAEAAFAVVVGVLNALPRVPLAAIAAVALALAAAAIVQSNAVGPTVADTGVQWLVLILPLCWAALGVTTLIAPALRRRPVVS